MINKDTITNAKDSIKTHEDFSKIPYPDTIYGWGKPTFGYGFTYITEEEGEYILNNRINSIVDFLEKKIKLSGHPKGVQEAMIEMCYQLGIGGFSNFRKMLDYLEKLDYQGVETEMLNSRWYRQTPRRVEDLIKKIRGAK